MSILGRFIVLISLMLCINIAASNLPISKIGKVFTKIENCRNAIDDDGDGLIDLNDDDCICQKGEPESLIPNPSFEETNCCPQNRSELDCANGWIQASDPTTDFLHTCGWMGWPNLPPPLPFPDGKGAVGFRDGRNTSSSPERNWKEYSGACLLNPLKANKEYTFEFHVGFINPVVSPPIEISFFGTAKCINLPFGVGNQSLGCPTNGPDWQFLGSNRVFGSNIWVKTSITITPKEDIYAIAIGPPCAPSTGDVNLYYFFDNLILAESKFFNIEIEQNGKHCGNDFLLSTVENIDYNYQWYKDGIAIIGETTHEYFPHTKEGVYNVLVEIEGNCKLSDDYNYKLKETYSFVNEKICENESFNFNGNPLLSEGIYIDTVKNIENCDSIIVLELEVIGDEEEILFAKFFQGDDFKVGNFVFKEPGQYDLKFQTSFGCDSLVELNLTTYNLFIPNVFSPNEDGFNDVFQIYNYDNDISITSLIIYSRWGSKVFHANSFIRDVDPTWDGNLNGIMVEEGTYTYMLELKLKNGGNKILIGDITLVL